MTEADIVYSDVTFIKTKERAVETTSTPEDTTYSEVKVSKTKSPKVFVDPQKAVHKGGSTVTSLKLAIGLLTVLLTAAVIGLVLTSYFYFQTMENLQQLAAENRNLTETYSQEILGRETCPAFVNTTNLCTNCPSGWEEFGGQCYYLSDNRSEWQKARDECQKQGADLAQVSSVEEQTFLTERTKQIMDWEMDRFWIGMNDSETEGTWLWVDGSPVDEGLTFWSYLEPDNWYGEDPERGEDCGNLGSKSNGNNCWFDRDCRYPLRHICEKPGKLGHLLCAEM